MADENTSYAEKYTHFEYDWCKRRIRDLQQLLHAHGGDPAHVISERQKLVAAK